MTEICPTILAHTTDDFAAQIARLEPFAKRVQIDIADGDFASPATVNLNQIYWPDGWDVDLHLMLRKPTEWIEMLVALAPSLVILHVEAEGDLAGMAEHLRKFDIKIGMALLPETQPNDVRELITRADHVLLFAGKLGAMGGAADLDVLRKVANIREINPQVEIGWDGGANVDNVREISQAGVDVVNVGSAILQAENPRAAYDDLRGKVR